MAAPLPVTPQKFIRPTRALKPKLGIKYPDGTFVAFDDAICEKVMSFIYSPSRDSTDVSMIDEGAGDYCDSDGCDSEDEPCEYIVDDGDAGPDEPYDPVDDMKHNAEDAEEYDDSDPDDSDPDELSDSFEILSTRRRATVKSRRCVDIDLSNDASNDAESAGCICYMLIYNHVLHVVYLFILPTSMYVLSVNLLRIFSFNSCMLY